MLKNNRDRTSLDPHPPVDVPQPSFASPRSKELKLVEEGTTIPEADVMSLNQQPLEKGEIDTEIMNPQIDNQTTSMSPVDDYPGGNHCASGVLFLDAGEEENVISTLNDEENYQNMAVLMLKTAETRFNELDVNKNGKRKTHKFSQSLSHTLGGTFRLHTTRLSGKLRAQRGSQMGDGSLRLRLSNRH